MKKINIQFLSSVLVMCFFGATSVDAAPSVRMLGTNTARVGSNAAVVKTENNATPSTQRLGSIRPKTVTGGTPVLVNKVTSKNTSSSVADDSRLSLGKYIHSTGTAAGTINSSASVPSTSSSEFVNLADRVTKLEGMETGTGLALENYKLSLDDDISGLPARVDDLEDEIDGWVDTYYTKTEINSILDSNGLDPEASTTIYNTATGERTSVEIVEDFDENFDFTAND